MAPSVDFNTWLATVAKMQGRTVPQLLANQQNYNLQAAYQAGAMPDARGHLSDVGKTPQHITFSTESVLNGQNGEQGGVWGGDDKSGWTFTAGPSNLKYHTPDELQQYFKQQEPYAKLAIPPEVQAPPGVAPIQPSVTSLFKGRSCGFWI